MADQKFINPANEAPKAKRDPGRIPMSAPVQKLEVVNIPGFHTHWMRGTPERIQQALRAGYVFVKQDEVDVNFKGIAGSPLDGGNTDLGTNVSIPAGRTDERGESIRLVLMKLPLELWDEDQKAMEARQDQVAAALRGGQAGMENAPGGSDLSNRYLPSRGNNRNIFVRRRT